MSTPMSDPAAAERAGMTTTPKSPVDNRTYNVISALASKLEALDTYQKYERDGASDVWAELIRDDRRHADRLLEELRGLLRDR
jgi:hypothetical protein